jgi:hypothetical protein
MILLPERKLGESDDRHTWQFCVAAGRCSYEWDNLEENRAVI